MKKILTALIATASLGVSAQTVSSYDVCESIRQNTSWTERVTQCMGIITQNQIDPNVIPLLVNLAKESTTETLNALQVSANKMFQYDAVGTCEIIRTQTSWKERVTECLGKVANNNYDIAALDVINKLAASSTTEALKALPVIANRYFEPEALIVCKTIDQQTSWKERVTSCLEIVADKTFTYGATVMCERTASQSTNEALSCLQTIAQDYIPTPIPEPMPEPIPTPVPTPGPTNGDDLIVNARDLNRISAKAKRAQKMLDEGNVNRARALIDGVVKDLDDLKAISPRY